MVVASARDTAALAAVAAERPRIVTSVLDLAQPASFPDAVSHVISHLGGLDGLIVTGGVLGPIAPVQRSIQADWLEAIAVDLSGPVLLAAAAHSALARGDRPVIVVLSSGAALAPVAGWSAYCAAKAGLNAALAVLDLDWREQGIKVHGIYPGGVDTDMQRVIRENGASGMDPAVHRRHLEFARTTALKGPRAVAALIARFIIDLPAAALLVHVNDLAKAEAP